MGSSPWVYHFFLSRTLPLRWSHCPCLKHFQMFFDQQCKNDLSDWAILEYWHLFLWVRRRARCAQSLWWIPCVRKRCLYFVFLLWVDWLCNRWAASLEVCWMHRQNNWGINGSWNVGSLTSGQMVPIGAQIARDDLLQHLWMLGWWLSEHSNNNRALCEWARKK